MCARSCVNVGVDAIELIAVVWVSTICVLYDYKKLGMERVVEDEGIDNDHDCLTG